MKEMPCPLPAAGDACAKGAGNLLGFALLESQYDGENSILLSPLSLACALAMAADGALGETREELLHALRLVEPKALAELLPALGHGGLSTANALYARPELALQPAYEALLRERWQAEVFRSYDAGAINAWISRTTGGLIENVMPDRMDADMALISTAAMDALWACPFDPIDTRRDDFASPSGPVQADMMHLRLHRAVYGERNGTQLLRLDYADSGLCMLLALPAEGGMEDLLHSLTCRGLAYFSCMKEQTRRVNLTLPRCDISTTLSLHGALQALGMEKTFAFSMDFAPMNAAKPMRIEQILQNCRLQIDEEGTRAAAVTLLEMCAGDLPTEEEPVEMELNRPFACIIADRKTGIVCFAGVVANPGAALLKRRIYE